MPKHTSRTAQTGPPDVPHVDPSANPRQFPSATRVEPISPFAERWAAKKRDYEKFASCWNEFTEVCNQLEYSTLSLEPLIADWTASWAKNAFDGFSLPQHPSVPRETLVAALSDISAFVEAYRFIFPMRAHVEAKRFWAYTLPGDHGQYEMPKADCLWRLMPELRLRPGSPIDPWPHGRIDQRQFFQRASAFLNSPSPDEWQWLRRLAWGTDDNQPIWGDGVPFDRWTETLCVSLPIISGAIGMDEYPEITDRSIHFDLLVQRVEIWCRRFEKQRQGPPSREDQEQTNPPPTNTGGEGEEDKSEDDSPPKWNDLGDAKRAILTVLNASSERIRGAEIAKRAGYTHGTLRHHFPKLKIWKYIDNLKGGYGIMPNGAALIPSERV